MMVGSALHSSIRSMVVGLHMVDNNSQLINVRRTTKLDRLLSVVGMDVEHAIRKVVRDNA
jgi:hypothetical protein